MHRRNRTWPLDNSPNDRCRQRVLEVSGNPIDGTVVNFGYTAWVNEYVGPWWANLTGGSDVKSEAAQVSMNVLPYSATISLLIVSSFDGDYDEPVLSYAKNLGVTTTYTAPFSVAKTDSLSIGFTPPDQLGNGLGSIVVYADGNIISTIPYEWTAP
jgi:hypothetical protein